MGGNEYGRCRILKPWPEWDCSIHTEKAQIARQGWAMTYPFTFTIDPDLEIGQFSSTSDLPYYDTTLFDCTCHDFQDRKLPCKHIYRLAVELGVIEIFRRPAFDAGAIERIRSAPDVDADPEQVKRQERAKERKMAPLSVDFDAQTAIFAGSGSKPYVTTLGSCTCRDFGMRQLPCKHIYRLRMELERAGKAVHDNER